MDTYDFASKHLYRARRESAIDRMVSKPKALRKVAYLDTSEALDTISYLRRGYRAENLWAINREPAEVAALSLKLKRSGLPLVNTVGLDFEDALARRVPDVDVIDFDGMACLHDSLAFMLARVTRRQPAGVFGVTVLGGREHAPTKVRHNRTSEEFWSTSYTMPVDVEPERTSFGNIVNGRHAFRIRLVMDAMAGLGHHKDWFDAPCHVHFDRVIWDVYGSISGQPMVWCVVQTSPHAEMTRREYQAFSSRAKGLCPPPGCCVREVVDTSTGQVLQKFTFSDFKKTKRIPFDDWQRRAKTGREPGAWFQPVVQK